MVLSEKNLLFPQEINRRIYSCLDKNTLLLGICTEKDLFSNSRLMVCPFPQYKTVSPWSIRTINEDALHVGELINYKVFSQDELFFLLGYEDKKQLNLNTLVDLRQDYSRCSFEVSELVFLDLLKDTNRFSNCFKYSSLVNGTSYKDFDYTKEYKYLISIFDTNTVLHNIYESAFSGVCISFDILDNNQILIKRKPFTKGVYFIFTNSYNGIFYKDGKDNILNVGFDIGPLYLNLLSKLDKYNSQRAAFLVKKASIEEQNKVAAPAVKKDKKVSDILDIKLSYEEHSLYEDDASLYEDDVLEEDIPVEAVFKDVHEEAVPTKKHFLEEAFIEANYKDHVTIAQKMMAKQAKNISTFSAVLNGEFHDIPVDVPVYKISTEIKPAKPVEKKLDSYAEMYGMYIGTTANTSTRRIKSDSTTSITTVQVGEGKSLYSNMYTKKITDDF